MCDYKTVHKDDGTVTIEAADKLAAEIMVNAYVPDFQDLGLTFTEAYDEAIRRDEEAAAQLKTDASNVGDYEEDDSLFTAQVNAAFAQAETEDLLEAEQEYAFIVNTLLQPVGVEAMTV